MSESKAESMPSAYQKLLDELPRTGPGTRGGEMLGGIGTRSVYRPTSRTFPSLLGCYAKT